MPDPFSRSIQDRQKHLSSTPRFLFPSQINSLPMSSLRSPFSFFHQSNGGNNPRPPSIATAAVAVAAAGVGTGLAVTLISSHRSDPSRPTPWARSSPAWAALSLEDAVSVGPSVEPKTGATFPSVIAGGRRLLGVGLRRKCLFGLKNIDVYAFGIYVGDDDINKLKEKYGTLSASELRDTKEFYSDVLDEDIRMTVKLQIVYGRLRIQSVRSAFEESVGNRLKKFSQSDNKELLQRFTSIFKDEYKIPKGCHIDLSREEEHNLYIRIDEKEVGCIQSQLLCKSIFDLYVGDNPLDKKAKDDYDIALASLLQD